MKSPPGGGILASPKRASSGPASRKEARIALESSSSTVISERSAACSRTLLSAIQATSTPSRSSRQSWASVSRIRGTLWTSNSSSVSRRGGEDRQGGVLVARRGDLTRERDPTLDDKFFHRKRLQIE